MVRIPTQDVPSGSLQPTQADPSAAATLGGEVVDLSKGIGVMAEHFQKVQDESYTNKAQADLINRFGAIHSQYAQDNDLATAPQRAQEDLHKAVEEVSSTIPGASARDSFRQQATIEMARKSTDLNNMFLSKQIKEAKYNLFNAVDTQIKQAWNSTRPDQITQAKQDITKLVNDAVSTGYVEPEAAKYYLETHLDKLVQGQVDHDLNLPGMAERVNEELKKGSSGMYPDLDDKARAIKISASERMIKRQAAEQREALKKVQSDNGNYIFNLWKNKQLNAQTIQEFGYSGRISQKEFQSWQKKYDDPNIHGETDPVAFNESIHFMTDPKNSMDSVRQHLLGYLSNNKLSKEDFQNLYEMHLKPLKGGDFQSAQNLYGKEQEYKDIMTTHKGFLKASLNLIGKFVGDKNEDKMASMIARFVSKNKQSTTPEDYPRLANDVLKEQRVMDRPEIVGYPDEGRVEQDEDGNRSTITPDGGLKEDEDTDNAPDGY